MKNMTELRDNLAMLYKDLRNGNVEPKVAKELTNIAGKMISSAALQVKVADINKQKVNLPFLK